jgi:hypothetical protein
MNMKSSVECSMTDIQSEAARIKVTFLTTKHVTVSMPEFLRALFNFAQLIGNFTSV